MLENAQRMAEYLEKNFGLRPEKTGENPDRKFILYRIGPTIVDFFEPILEDTALARLPNPLGLQHRLRHSGMGNYRS